MTDDKHLPKAEEVDAKFSQPITTPPADTWDHRTMPNAGEARQSTTGVTSEREEVPSPEEPHQAPAQQAHDHPSEATGQIQPADKQAVTEAKEAKAEASKQSEPAKVQSAAPAKTHTKAGK